jgi:hypothetical protein
MAASRLAISVARALIGRTVRRLRLEKGLAQQVLANGQALEKLNQFIAYTNR